MTEETMQVRAKFSSTAVNEKLAAIFDAMQLGQPEDETPEEKAINFVALSIFIRIYLYESGLLNLATMEPVIQDIMFRMNGANAVTINQNWVAEVKKLLESGTLGEGMH